MLWVADPHRHRYRHGAQNAYDSASKQTLDSEFGTSNEDEVIKQILEKGDVQHTEVKHGPNISQSLHMLMPTCKQTGERQGPKNDSMGTRQAH